MKDLIIGAADNYEWTQLKPWAVSITQSGFDGDVVLIVYRVDQEVIQECERLGIIVVAADSNEMAQPINHQKFGMHTQAHQLRNFHMWQYLHQAQTQYRWVIVTDTRDLYFQYNPIEWLVRHWNSEADFLLPSESLTFGNEEWNDNMAQLAFGPVVWHYVFRNQTIVNSGSFVGRGYAIKDLLLVMYLISRYIALSGIDQGTLNLLGQTMIRNVSVIQPMNSGWCCQCGTTLDPTKSFLWNRLREPQPKILTDGTVVNSYGHPFALVHQWTRVPQLKEHVERKFGIA